MLIKHMNIHVRAQNEIARRFQLDFIVNDVGVKSFLCAKKYKSNCYQSFRIKTPNSRTYNYIHSYSTH